jgi:ABC-type oligopeptide transport system substrate-binding subunit
LLISLIAVLALGLAACGDDDEGDDGDTGTPAPTGGTGTPAPTDGGDGRIEGGELTVQSVEFASLDPHFSSFAQDISIQRMLWRGLYTLDIDNVPQPAMASAAPEVSADGLTVTVPLREGLVWSDGDDLLAEDFVAGIKRTCNPVNAGEYYYVLLNIAGCADYYGALAEDALGPDATDEELQPLHDAVAVEAVDDTTVEFTLLEPQPTFPIIISLWMTFPVPVHIDRFANATPTAPGDWGTDGSALAFNGPYVLTGYSPQESATLEPNESWSADYSPVNAAPTLDTLTIRFIDDLAQAANAYRNDELSSTDVDLTQLETIVSEFGEGEEYFKFLTPSTRGLQMQMEVPPLDDFNVRLALSRAIDREALNQVAVQGGNEPSTSWIPEVTGGHPPDEFDDIIGFDPEAAAAALAEAGYPDGDGFPTLTILVSDAPQNVAVAEFLQDAFLTNLNIDTEVEIVDGPTRSSRFTEEQFELFHGGWIQDYPDPENWILGLFDTPGTLNHYNCSDPDIDALVEEARFNTDDTERKQQYLEINTLISERLCGIAVYWHENNHWLVKPDLLGVREYISGQDGSIAADWAAEAWGLSE